MDEYYLRTALEMLSTAHEVYNPFCINVLFACELLLSHITLFSTCVLRLRASLCYFLNHVKTLRFESKHAGISNW